MILTPRTPALTVLALGALACGDGGSDPATSPCRLVGLPLAGGANAPVVTDVGLEIQTDGIVIVATATDPQGGENMRDVLQSVGVFPDTLCEGAPLVLQDDLVDSGVEETFGTVVDVAQNPALYAEIAGALNWPVEVDFFDLDGNRTGGRVRARLIR